MTKKTRTALLVVMILFFAVLAPAVILYSIGYRLDIKMWELTETGAIFLKTEPRGASVTVDGKNRGTTPKTLRSLVPRDYHIMITKEGRHSWSKTLEVHPQLLTEADAVILPPLQVPLDVVVDATFDDLNISPSGQWLVGAVEKTLYYHRVSDGEMVASVSLAFSDLAVSAGQWSPNERGFLLPERSSSTLLTLGDVAIKAETLPSNLFWGPQDNDALFRIVRSQTGERFLQRIERSNGIVRSFPTPITSVAVAGDAFLARVEDPTPHLELWDSAGRNLNVIILLEEKLADPDVQPLPESNRDFLIMQHNKTGQTWIYDGQQEVWRDLGLGVFAIVLAHDQKKAAVLKKDGSLVVQWLRSEETQPLRRPGDVELITRITDGGNTSFQWMTEGAPYLLTAQNNRIWMTELDGRDTRNRWPLFTLRSPSIYAFPGAGNTIIVSGGVAYKTRIE